MKGLLLATLFATSRPFVLPINPLNPINPTSINPTSPISPPCHESQTFLSRSDGDNIGDNIVDGDNIRDKSTPNRDLIHEIVQYCADDDILKSLNEMNDQQRDNLNNQIHQLEKAYPGGIHNYVKKAKQLLNDAINHKNPVEYR